MMTHGGMLWQAALYNNGAFPYKDAHFGESYSPDGEPQRIQTVPAPTEQELTRIKGVLPAARSSGPVGDLAAREYPARIRTRRRPARRDRQSQSATKIPASPTTS